MRDWLLSQPCIQEFPLDQLAQERQQIIARNTAREARLEARERAYIEGDPLAFAVKALCAQIGATPVSLLTREQRPSIIRRAGGKREALLWSVHTDRGQLLLDVHPPATPFSPPLARLTHLDMRAPKKPSIRRGIPKIRLAKMPITKAQYDRVLQLFAIA
ncbi:MAG: hypothetical protein ABMA14_23070 [Hyphomonadaceae bacterium]